MAITRPFAPPKPPKPASPFGGTLGVMAIAFGIGVLGAYMLDLHSHTCEACGRKWRHLGAFNLGDPASHTCAQCGTVQWWKDGVPHVFRTSLHAEPPATTDAARWQQLALAPGDLRR